MKRKKVGKVSKKKEFNWFTELRRLIKRKTPIDITERSNLNDRAGQWTSCACGQICKALPRSWRSYTSISFDGEPKDYQLRRLGIQFYNRVSRQDWIKAHDIMHRIEFRAAYLLQKMYKNESKAH